MDTKTAFEVLSDVVILIQQARNAEGRLATNRYMREAWLAAGELLATLAEELTEESGPVQDKVLSGLVRDVYPPAGSGLMRGDFGS
jgi:hypothetical protein